MTSPSARLALGIHFGHDAAVSLCSPDRILFSLQEERVSRIKHHFGFPRQALEIALARSGAAARDIPIVAFSSSQVLFADRPSWVVPADADRAYSKALKDADARLQRTRDKVQRTWSEFAG